MPTGGDLTFTVTTDPTWTSWAQDTTAATTNLVWATWSAPTMVPPGEWRIYQQASVIQQPVVETAEQIGARVERERVAREEAEALRQKRQEARDRAEVLLRDNLTEDQAKELDETNRFHLDVISRNGSRRRYQINRGRENNVYEVDENGERMLRICAHPREYVPDADTMLAQKLMLETDDDAFLEVANLTRMRAA